MSKAWKIVSAIVIIALLVGVLCVFVGLFTGGSMQRVLDAFNAAYDIDGIRQAYEQAIQNALQMQPLN